MSGVWRTALKHQAPFCTKRRFLYQRVNAIDIAIGDKYHRPIVAMSALSTNGINGAQYQKDHTPSQALSSLSLSSQAIHADDFLNINQDVAPALHVSTTFRYSSNPDKLVPSHQLDVRGNPFSSRGATS
jgi:hypothetical protein